MPKNKRLLRTPRPHSDESLKGLIVRATEENGYDSPSTLLSFADLVENERTQKTIYTEPRWKNLSGMLNVEIPALQDLACLSGIEGTSSKFYNICGQVIHKYSVRIAEPKICPACLRQSNHIRKIWDLAAFTCCPEHGTLLLDECPSCGKHISWARGRVSVCSCGQDWRELLPPEANESDRTLSQLIWHLCGLSKSETSSADATNEEATRQRETTCNPLSAVSLNELLSSVYFIASLKHGVIDATGKKYAMKLSHKELHEALTKAVVVFEDWPSNYYRFIEECWSKIPAGSGQSGLYKDFGRLYDPLFVRKNNPLPDFMRDEFERYITTCWDKGNADNCGNMTEGQPGANTCITKHEAAKHLQVGVQTVNLLHKKGFLRGPFYPWINRNRIMIEADSVRELKERWDKSITAAEAGEMLGIGRIAVVSLEKNGCLAAIPGPAATRQLEWKFEVADVERLLQSGGSEIRDRNRPVGAHPITFHEAIQKLSKSFTEVGVFVNLILDGKITPVAKGDGTGLAALLFDAVEIEQFSKSETADGREDRRTLKEAAKLLRTSTTETYFLINHSFLIATNSAAVGRGIWSITQAEIDRFKATYSTVEQIVQVFCTSTRGLSKRLMDSGIVPVTGPKIDGGSIYFFKNTDLEAVDLAKILPKTNNTTLEKMNEQGLVNTKQVVDITGLTLEEVRRIVWKRKIIPAATYEHKDGVKATWFFSPDQVEKFKKLKADEEGQLTLSFNDVPMGSMAA